MAVRDNTGPAVNARVAKEILGWKNVHRDHKNGNSDEVWAKKPDKLGRWRKTRVPNFYADIGEILVVENRLRQLGRFERYTKELARIAAKDKLPVGWATADQRCRAALTVISKRAKRSK